MEIMEVMKQRHSVRQYTDRKIEDEKRDVLNALCQSLNDRYHVHIQMIYDEPYCFDTLLAHYGKFTGVNNYIALVGTKSDELEYILGYCGEQLVLKAQELGLNTCWVALTHGKTKAVVNAGETQVCVISIGYGMNTGKEHKNRKINEVCNLTDTSPDWFEKGMEAVMTAPTALNQQKFFFEYREDGNVHARSGKGFYTKMDLGIACYHFEAATGKKVMI